MTARDAAAAIFTVTNTADSGPGSLRQAIVDANADAAADTIVFALPPNDPGYDSGSDTWTIQVFSQLLVRHAVTIDGYSQPGAQANTQPVGQGLNTILKVVIHFNVSSWNEEAAGFFFDYFSEPCLVKGLALNGVANTSSGPFWSLVFCGSIRHKFQGNFFGTDAAGHEAQTDGTPQTNATTAITTASDLTVGGLQPADRNLFAGRSMKGLVVSHATIQGNLFGTTKDGLGAQHLKSGMDIVFLNQIGGAAPGAGNVINSDGGSFTIIDPPPAIAPTNSGRNVVEGNFIGTDVTGTVALGPNSAAILLQSDNDRIGGTSPGQGNLISGNALGGLKISSLANVVQGNLIGTKVDGQSPLPNGYGIRIQPGFFRGASGNLIGKAVGGGGNTIAFNKGAGISVEGADQNAIYQNEIYQNDGIGIDLGNNGVTPNDLGDADSGPNGLQNYPVLTSAYVAGGTVVISGTLNSVPNQAYYLECFGSDKPDPSGFGEGKYFLGSTFTFVENGGYGGFSVALPYRSGIQTVAVTATDPNGNTSEFSAALPIGGRSHNLNLSTRAFFGTGDNVLIGGFIITGADPKRVMVRGIGPSLGDAGVAGVLADPIIELYDRDHKLLASNDDWKSDQRATIEQTGIPPKSDLEGAIVTNLKAVNSSYTVVVRGKNSGTGIGLVEIYDLDAGADSRLANMSSRGMVGLGDNVLIGGFIIGGNGEGPGRALVRGLGPSIGLSTALADPTLELRDADGVLIAANDDWKENEQQIREAGLPPQYDTEAALVRPLAPGPYTAILRGKNNTTGIGLLEVYNFQ